MGDLFRRARSGEWRAFGRFLATLVVSLGLTLYVVLQLSVQGCGPSSGAAATPTPVAQCQAEAQDTTHVALSQKPFYADIVGLSQQVLQGEWQSLYLNAAHLDLPPTARVTFLYTPPAGVTNLGFPGNPPTNPQGPPPYVFNNISLPNDGNPNPKHWQHSESIQVEYRWPLLPAGETDLAVSQKFEVVVEGRGSNVLPSTTLIRGAVWQVTPWPASKDAGPIVAATPATPQLDAEVSAQRMADVLSQQLRWDIPLTTKLCQELADLLQDGRFFLALRLPTNTTDSTGATLPLLFAPEARPALVMKDESRQYFSLPLEYTPQQAEFMARYLPAAAHTQWVALGAVASPQVVCPAKINRGPGWEFRLNLPLDLDAQPSELQCYYCYQGQNNPFASLWEQAGAAMAGGQAASSPVRAQGLTCLGPYPVRVNSGFPVQLMGAKAALDARPGQRVAFVHGLKPAINSTAYINIHSSLDVTWRAYGGTWTTPNTQPLPTAFFAPSTSITPIWIISDPLPQVEGGYAVTITATAHYQGGVSTSWTTDSVWVGDWAAPPKQWSLSLPLVLRNKR